MPDEIRDFAREAQAQSQEFLRESRQQMHQQLQEQRAQLVGVAPGMAAGGAGGGRYPQPGTPAGRLMETITDLVRSGASMGAGAVAGAARPFAMPFQVAGQAAGYFAGGSSAFGPTGVSGGMFMDARDQMSLMQSMWTAYGRQVMGPDWGRYAGIRMDMTRHQAQQMAQEELSSRLSGGFRRGIYGAANVLTLGYAGFRMRRAGTEMERVSIEEMTRQMQGQLRYVTREDLAAGGMADMAGPFMTGVSREGARNLVQGSMDNLRPFQQRLGLTGEEVMTLASRAMGTMGSTRISQLVGQGPQAFGRELGRQTGYVREIQQILHLSGEEAVNFFKMVGQIQGTAEDIVKAAREARQIAGRTGMNVRDVSQTILGFQQTGIQMGLGAERARGVATEMIQTLRAQERSGVIGRREMFMYGGQTFEEAISAQARMRFQQNLAMWQRGGLGGVGMLATQDPAAFQRFMSGGAGFFQTMGAVGGAFARDPWARLRAQYDPRQYEVMGLMGGRAAYMQSQQMLRGGFFLGDPAAQRFQAMDFFREQMNMQPLEARARFNQYAREHRSATKMAAGFGAKPNESNQDAQRRHTQGIWSIYTNLLGQGLGGFAMGTYGTNDPMEAARRIYEQATNGGSIDFDPSTMDVTDILAARAGAPVNIAGIARAMEDVSGRIMQQELELSPTGMAPAYFRAGRSKVRKDPVREMRYQMGGVNQILDAIRRSGSVSGRALTRFVFGNARGINVTALSGQANLSINRQGQFILSDRSGQRVLLPGEIGTELGGEEAARIANLLRNATFPGGEEDRRGFLQGLVEQGDLRTRESEMWENLVFGRRREIMSALFPSGLGPDADPERRYQEVMRRVAQSDVADPNLYGRMGRLNMQSLQAFSNIYRVQNRRMVLQGRGREQVEAFRGLFGAQTAERLAGILQRTEEFKGITPDVVTDILEGRREGEKERFFKAFEQWDVAGEVFRQALKVADSTKTLMDLGTSDRPMYVTPKEGAWDGLFKGAAGGPRSR